MTDVTRLSLSTCDRCGVPLAGRSAYLLDGQRRCLRCAVRHRPLVRRSALTALVVGTVLVLINHGDGLANGQVSPNLLWKLPLTDLVPFCVASWGSLAIGRCPRQPL